jgi:hypothetical protein
MLKRTYNMNLCKERGDVGRKWVGKLDVGCELDSSGSEYSPMGNHIQNCNESLCVTTGRKRALRSNYVFVDFIF